MTDPCRTQPDVDARLAELAAVEVRGCEGCGGSATCWETSQESEGAVTDAPCPACNGTGREPCGECVRGVGGSKDGTRYYCPTCHGTGFADSRVLVLDLTEEIRPTWEGASGWGDGVDIVLFKHGSDEDEDFIRDECESAGVRFVDGRDGARNTDD